MGTDMSLHRRLDEQTVLVTGVIVVVNAAITIGFTGNMIFDVLFILVILCELINERFITAIRSETFCAHKVHMLHFVI